MVVWSKLGLTGSVSVIAVGSLIDISVTLTRGDCEDKNSNQPLIQMGLHS